MKKLIGLTLLSLFFNSVIAQQDLEMGYFFSNTHEPIDNMLAFDPIKGNAINISVSNWLHFMPGYYTNLNDKKIKGYLRKNNSEIFEFKETQDQKEPIEIGVEQAKTYKIGLDSFAVMENIKTVNSIYSYPIIKKSQFVLIDSYNDSIVTYKYMKHGVPEYFFNYKNNYYSIPSSSKEIKKLLLGLFHNNQILKDYINEVGVKEQNITQLFNMLRRYKAAQNGDSIYLNRQYEECDIKEASYYQIIERTVESTYKLSSYNVNHQKLFSGTYQSFKTQVRHGEYKWYYPNGNLRKTATYYINEVSGINSYFSNGQLHYKIKISSSGTPKYERVYNTFGDELNNKKNPIGYELLYDSVRSRKIMFKFRHGTLVESNVLKDPKGKTYSQKTKRNLKYSAINDAMWSEFKSILKYDDRMIKAGEHGTAYVRVLVDSNGKLDEIEILEGISKETDEKILKAFILTDQSYQIWKGAKNFDQTSVAQEIVIPINFNIRSDNIVNKFYYHNQFLQPNHFAPINFDNIPVPQGFR